MTSVAFRCFRFVALTAALALCGAGGAHAFDHAQVARQVLERHIVPRYQEFTASAGDLAETDRAYCSGEPGHSLGDVRAAFTDATIAWGRIAHIRFGPVATDNRFERILFWPDPRQVTAMQVGKLLRKKPAEALQPEYFASASVAVSGLRPLELVLFGRGSERLEALNSDAARYRCGFAQALAGALHRNATEILAEWSETGAYRKLWLNPGADNPRFLKPSETTQALVQSFTDRIDRLLAFDIPAPSAEGSNANGSADAVEPLFASSAAAVAYLTASLDGLEELLRAGGFIDQAEADDAEIRERLDAVLNELRFARRGLGIVAEAGKPEGFASVPVSSWQAVRLPLQNARHLADETLKVQAGLSSGFNALDGD